MATFISALADDMVLVRRNDPPLSVPEISVIAIRISGRTFEASRIIEPTVKQNCDGVWEIGLRPFGLVSYGYDLEETISGFCFMLLVLYRDFAMASNESSDERARRWQRALVRYFPDSKGVVEVVA